MKRLIVCCDGTWQSPRSDHPTNVVKLLEAIPPVAVSGPQNTVSQVLYYDEGLGTRNRLEKLGGGAFGWGLDAAVEAAYRFLCLNWEPDDEIYLFGFSRGAYTVRSLAGLIYNCDLLQRCHLTQAPKAMALYRNRLIPPKDDFSVRFRQRFAHPQRPIPADQPHLPPHAARITALGCFDTVGSLGIPDLIPYLPLNKIINRKYEFNDPNLSPIVERAFHAVAVDEHRKVFDYTGMTEHHLVPGQLRQVWFPGDHGCIGGGSTEKETLSNQTLVWMLDEMQRAKLGLVVDRTRITGGLATNPAARYGPEKGIFKLLGALGPIDRKIPADAELHPSVEDRIVAQLEDYNPQNLPPRPPGPTTKTSQILSAGALWNETGLEVTAGQSYRVDFIELEPLDDGGIPAYGLRGCGFGWRHALAAPLFWLRRHPTAPFFALIATVDGKHPRRIYGPGRSQTTAAYQAPATGKLIVSFNDMPFARGNNRGKARIHLTPLPN